MTRNERVLKLVRAMMENKRKLENAYRKDGESEWADKYLSDYIVLQIIEWVLTGDRQLEEYFRIYCDEADI